MQCHNDGQRMCAGGFHFERKPLGYWVGKGYSAETAERYLDEWVGVQRCPRSFVRQENDRALAGAGGCP